MKKLLLFLAITLAGCRHHKVDVKIVASPQIMTFDYGDELSNSIVFPTRCWYDLYNRTVPNGFEVKGWICDYGKWIEYQETSPL